jgi:hypothetical protein
LNAMGEYGGLTNEAMDLQVGLPWMRWWFCVPRHLNQGDYINKGTNCPLSHRCPLCSTLKQSSCSSVE